MTGSGTGNGNSGSLQDDKQKDRQLQKAGYLEL